MPQICTIKFWEKLLLLLIVGLPLPAMALSSLIPASPDHLSFFALGLIYGGLGVLGLYNLSLIFRQFCQSNFFLLCYVLCIFHWVGITFIQLPNALDVLNTNHHIVLYSEIILLIPFSAGLFLINFIEQKFWHINKTNIIYGLTLTILMVVIISFTFSNLTHNIENSAIILLFALSSLIFAVLSYRKLRQPTSPIIFIF